MIDEKVGKDYWFEYHCLESMESTDASLWLHSHQKVTVLEITEPSLDTLEERNENGQPRIYKVKFEDGNTFDVFEDELMDNKESFYRPDPPKKI